MKKVTLTRNNMLFLFASVGTEMTWRHNAELQLYIPFTEYTEFIRIFSKNKYELLYFPISNYSKALYDENMLLKFFYFDLSRVIASEVSLSMVEGATPTAILPDVSGGVTLELSKCGNELFTYNQESIVKSMQSIKDEFFTDGVELPTHEGRSRDLSRLSYLLRTATTTKVVSKYKIKESVTDG